MASKPLDFTLRPAQTYTDFLSIAHVESTAFASEISLIRGPSPDLAPSTTRYHLNSQTDPTAHYILASLPSGEVIGYAKWNFFLDSPTTDHFPWPELKPPANIEMMKWFHNVLDGKRNEWMRGRRYLFMATLAVGPGWQRMGVGRRLLEWGLERADREVVPVWIDSSPVGKALYEKLGWREVGFVDTEMGRWGGVEGEVRRTVCMVRQPGERSV